MIIYSPHIPKTGRKFPPNHSQDWRPCSRRMQTRKTGIFMIVFLSLSYWLFYGYLLLYFFTVCNIILIAKIYVMTLKLYSLGMLFLFYDISEFCIMAWIWGWGGCCRTPTITDLIPMRSQVWVEPVPWGQGCNNTSLRYGSSVIHHHHNCFQT